ncbi:MAG: class I SAM-dependent methyltransferase [Anaerolineales bacterium]|nr:class I SAM-dependent methyltransferase [Anaerolineales bacterium]
MSELNYDPIANQYNQRYPAAQKWPRGQALLDLAERVRAETILEVGCGTGFWLNLLRQRGRKVFGADYSLGMLHQAKGQPAPLHLAQADATRLPYPSSTFDLVYCVDAIHHFGDHRAFVAEAARLLKPRGALAVLGHDPHAGSEYWYIYKYFDGVYQTDLRRYPAATDVARWVGEEGLQHISVNVAEQICNVHMGAAVLDDPFLKHSATSQLALLSEADYQRGVERIREALARAAENGETINFRSEIDVKMVCGFKLA